MVVGASVSLCGAGVQLEEPFSVLPLDRLARECQDDITELITSMQGAISCHQLLEVCILTATLVVIQSPSDTDIRLVYAACKDIVETSLHTQIPQVFPKGA